MIQRVGAGKYVLKSKSTGKRLGGPYRKADAIAQERAIKAAQARRGQ